MEKDWFKDLIFAIDWTSHSSYYSHYKITQHLIPLKIAAVLVFRSLEQIHKLSSLFQNVTTGCN